ncbi:MAG: hypothetical protein WBA89_29390 [Microcoleus sp.]|uniref:hypothetical protein n=1 Tax=Microcoleus sp. TaxID=44472 RepID=UPI003C757C67
MVAKAPIEQKPLVQQVKHHHHHSLDSSGLERSNADALCCATIIGSIAATLIALVVIACLYLLFAPEIENLDSESAQTVLRLSSPVTGILTYSLTCIL